SASAIIATPGGGLHAYFTGSSQASGRLPRHHLDFKAIGGGGPPPPPPAPGPPPPPPPPPPPAAPPRPARPPRPPRPPPQRAPPPAGRTPTGGDLAGPAPACRTAILITWPRGSSG